MSNNLDAEPDARSITVTLPDGSRREFPAR